MQTWSNAPQDLALSPNIVDIWKVNLLQSVQTLTELETYLNPEELKRAYRFYFEKDQQRFIISRGALRVILGRYLNCSPTDLNFCYEEKGKPYLPEALEFNLSHSGLVTLIAIAPSGLLGVDIECHRELDNLLGLAHRVFSEVEYQQLLQAKPEEQIQTFFNGWTRKEAYIKACGLGLYAALKEFSVTLEEQESPRFLHLPVEAGALEDWTLHSFKPETNYTAALALCSKQTQPSKLNFYQWEAE